MHILDAPRHLDDFRLPYGPDALQFEDFRLPANGSTSQRASVPTIIVIHGGFWRARYDIEHIGHLCAALTAEGYATWSLEYRRIGNPSGGWPGTLQDMARGAAHVEKIADEYHLDLDRVRTRGHSGG